MILQRKLRGNILRKVNLIWNDNKNSTSKNKSYEIFISKYIEGKDWTENSKNIFWKNCENLIKIFGQLEQKKQNTIMYGSVQSGKTGYLIVASQMAFINNYEFVIYLTGNKNNIHDQNSNDFENYFYNNNLKVNILNSNYNNFDLNTYKKGKNILLFKKITNDIKLLKYLSRENDFQKYRFLVIDDECDNASLNTKGNEEEHSFMNKAIKEFLKNKNVNYLGSTATPYFNLIMNYGPKPDKVFVLKNSDSYKGLEYYKDSKFYNLIENDLPIKKTKLLKKVIKQFIIDTINNEKINNPQLIINIDYLKKEIKKIGELVKRSLFELKNEFNLSNRKQEEDLIINKLKVNIWTSDNNIENFEYQKPNINIGGFMIGRGFRFENLTHVLIYSRAKKIALDTFVQRCRWFGYKKWDVKIWANNRLAFFYTKIAPFVDKKIKELFEYDESVDPNKINKINMIIKEYEKDLMIISNKRR